jgi:iron complex transport system ATP-binding protein
LLRDGRIIADGPKAEVLTSEGISALFGIPLRISQQDGYFHIRE